MARKTIEQKLAELDAQRAALKSRLGKQERANDTRRKVLLGALVLHRLENGKDEEFARRLRDWLKRELPDFLTRLRQRNGIGARALEFAVLTAARSGEVRGATWDEIDLEATSEALGIPVWWYTIATPAFSLLIIFRIAQRAIEDQRANNF